MIAALITIVQYVLLCMLDLLIFPWSNSKRNFLSSGILSSLVSKRVLIVTMIVFLFSSKLSSVFVMEQDVAEHSLGVGCVE